MSEEEILTLESWPMATFKAAQELCLAIEKDPAMPSILGGRRKFLAQRTTNAFRDLGVLCGFCDAIWVKSLSESEIPSASSPPAPVEFPSEAIVRSAEWEAWHSYQHQGRYHLERFPTQPTAYIPGLGTIHPCLDCGALIAGGVTRCLKCVSNLEAGEK